MNNIRNYYGDCENVIQHGNCPRTVKYFNWPRKKLVKMDKGGTYEVSKNDEGESYEDEFRVGKRIIATDGQHKHQLNKDEKQSGSNRPRLFMYNVQARNAEQAHNYEK